MTHEIAGIPVSKGGLISDTRQYFTRGHLFLADLQQRYGDIFYYRSPMGLQLMVLDPEAVDKIFNRRGVSDKNFGLYDNLRMTMGDGLVAIATNEEHIRRLRLMIPAYRPEGARESMDFYKSEILDEVNRMILSWHARGENFILNTKREFEELGLRIIFRIMFGRDEIAPGIRTMPKHIENIIRGLMTSVVLGRKIGSLVYGGKIRQSAKVVNNAIDDMIEVSRRARVAVSSNGSKNQRRYMLDVLVDLLDDNKITKQQLLDEFVTALSAGYETTARVLMTAFIQMAHNGAIQDRLVKDTRSTETAFQVEQVSYGKAVFQEATRFAPPAPGIARQLLEPVEVLGHTLPAGTIVNTLTWLMNMNTAVYGDRAATFLPERYQTLDKVPGAGDLAFGGFTRRCAGESIAMFEGACTVVKAVQSFRFYPMYPLPPLKLGIVLSPDLSKNGHLIGVQLRRN